MDVRLIAKCRCTRTHRTYAAAAKCIWRGSHHVHRGEGPYVVAHPFRCRCCGETTHYRLYATPRAANEALTESQRIHQQGKCCGSCAGAEYPAGFIAPSVVGRT